jgi:hypothetical protein
MRTTYIAALVSLTVLGSKPAVEAQGEGPCGLLTTAEVQQAFPGSKPGQLERKNEKHGILSCTWSYPTGVLSIIADVGNEATDSAKDEAEGWTLSFLDPLRNDAACHVRYEKLAGVGDEAIAIVEREDKAKGFARDAAILVVRRGKRQVSALSSSLAGRERADTLRVLAELGKAIAKRLG